MAVELYIIHSQYSPCTPSMFDFEGDGNITADVLTNAIPSKLVMTYDT